MTPSFNRMSKANQCFCHFIEVLTSISGKFTTGYVIFLTWALNSILATLFFMPVLIVILSSVSKILSLVPWIISVVILVIGFLSDYFHQVARSEKKIPTSN